MATSEPSAPKSLASLYWLRPDRLPVLRQDEISECGLACLAMLLSYHGLRIDLRSLRKRYPVSTRGTNLKQLMAMAEALGLNVRAVRFELEDIAQLQTPALLHWDINHFVVLASATARRVVVHDPAVGKRVLSTQVASKHITGIALEISPARSFTPRDERSPELRLRDLWTQQSGFQRVLLHTLMLSLVLQAATLVAPLFLQLVVDDVIQQHDASILLVLALGFGFVALVRVATESLRSFVVLSAGSLLSFQFSQNLMRHLLRLPMAFFEKRHVGDIASRFQSIEPVKQLLVTDLVEGLVDGLMASTTLAMMFWFSPKLATIVLLTTSVYVLLSALLSGPLRQRLQESILCRAKDTSTFLETIRTIQAVKLFGKESDRLNYWLNRHADVANAEFRLGKVRTGQETLTHLLKGSETLLVVYFAALSVLATEMTVGMLFAFIAYKTAFVEKVTSLVEKLLELRKLRVHLQRLADVVQTPPEEPDQAASRSLRDFDGSLRVRNLGFAYSRDEKAIFTDVSFEIRKGEALAIVGGSGSGKTTLLKVLTGLLRPTAGDVDLGHGCILHRNVLASEYRKNLGVVMQDDQLLSGTIGDNISFFDPNPDAERVVSCAKTACIHTDILAMTMGYETLVGDMGSLLSGGQKQRVLLARALYRDAPMLFMDEGTSHLDLATERQLNDNLKQLRVTRVMIAHRPDTLRLADRVYSLPDRAFIRPEPHTEPVQDDGSGPRLLEQSG